MQGKERNNNEIDQEFTDFSWGEMSKMLDQEMPVQKVATKPRRKKYLLLLLLLLISFSAGVGSMFFYQQNQTDPIPEAPPPQEQAPYADAQPPDIDLNLDLVEQQQKLLAEAPPPKKAKTKNKNLKNNSLIFNRLDGIKFTLNNSTSSSTSFSSSYGLPAIRQASEQLNQSRQSFYANAATSLLENNANEVDQAIQSVSHFTLFSEVDSKEIDLLNKDKSFAFADHLVKMKRKRLDLGLTVASLFDDDFRSTGFQSGIVLDLNFDKKFSLNTGLAFTRLVKNTYQAPVALTTAQHLEQAVFGGYDMANPITTNASNLEDSESANFPIDRIDYITIPATISYQFNRKLGFQTGVNFSYLLGSKNNEEYISSNDPDQQSGGNSASLRGYSDFLSKNGIKSIDVGIGIGMRYFVSDKVGIGMNYNIGLPDYTKDRVFGIREGHTNNYFKLSLNYYMKKL